MLKLSGHKLLVIAPHPDDEVLGCGGLIKRVKDAGGKVYILFLTVGETSEYSKNGFSTSDERLAEIEKVAKFLKYNDYSIAFPGNDNHLKLDQIPQKELISVIENGPKISLNKLKPTILACPQVHDYNQDHRAAAQAVFSSTRPAPNKFKPLQKIVLGYEEVATQWSSTNSINPNLYIKLSNADLKTKLKALSLYTSQVRNGNHTRSPYALKRLAFLRGSQCGIKAAEAFINFRIII